jgi:cell division transport system permease protein
MFILPLLAMLIGVEFILVFNRVTNSYEEKLKDSYAILVSSKEKLTTPYLRNINEDIDSVEVLNKGEIAKEVIDGVDKSNIDTILKEMPHFYRVHLKNYSLNVKGLEAIKKQLKDIPGVISVEIFGESYETRHNMFSLIKSALNIFIILLFIVSSLLIIKQMEVWQLAHKTRMQIMEIFGAPLMLRSGVLFKTAFIDAIIATILTFILSLYMKSHVDKIEALNFIDNSKDVIFNLSDIFVWILTALVIVFISVFYVAFKTSEVIEQ